MQWFSQRVFPKLVDIKLEIYCNVWRSFLNKEILERTRNDLYTHLE